MDIQEFGVRVNRADISSVAGFAQTEGMYSNFQKDTIFARIIGFDERSRYLQEIAAMDETLTDRQAKFGNGYLRIHQLDSYMTPEQVRCYALLQENNEVPFRFENAMWDRAMNRGFESVLRLFHRVSPHANETITRNFVVKFYGWMDRYMARLFRKTKGLGCFPKFVLEGPIKAQEYLFLWFLVQLGCDVLYLNPEGDLPDELGMLLDFSRVYVGEQTGTLSIPLSVDVTSKTIAVPVQAKPIRVHANRFRRPDRERSAVLCSEMDPLENLSAPTRHITCTGASVQKRQALSYEELAGFAPSVVMIYVYNENRECFKSGSGVFINVDGYILTNFHVVNSGAYFGVRIEDQNELFYTDKLIKYHDLNDLAILKIDRASRPIPIYLGAEELKRGQTVVAIGSPLGLFNSVSNGIISGFRKMDEVSMVQFSAPISHGSSGGALLNLYGNLIGIITAGFDGQNLNLAVDYQTVLPFVRGFMSG